MRFRKKTLSSPRLRKKRRSQLVRSSVFIVFSVFVLVGAFIFAISSDLFIIKSIEVVGTDEILAQEVKSAVEKELSGRKLLFFSKNNFLFLDKDEMISVLENGFPIFSKVRPNLAGLGNLIIEVKERAEYAKWCYKKEKEKCVPVDDEGVAFSYIKNEESTTTIKIFTESLPKYRNKIADKESFDFIRAVSSGLNNLDEKVVSFSEEGSDYFILLQDGTDIRISSKDTASEILEKFSSVKNDLKKEGSPSIEYVDLRFGNKIFLKRK